MGIRSQAAVTRKVQRLPEQDALTGMSARHPTMGDEIVHAAGNQNLRDSGEEYFDYENQLGVGVGTIWGLKKTQFSAGATTVDCGTIQVISTLSTGIVA